MNWSWPDAKGTIAVIIVSCMIVLSVVLFAFPSAMDGHPAILAVLQTLLGLLSASVTTVIQYYFGSSAESKSKGDVIAQIAAAGQNGSAPAEAKFFAAGPTHP